MTYTEEQKALISALLGTKIVPRTRSGSLRQSLYAANERLADDTLTVSDLILIGSALELLTPATPADASKEEYRELIEALLTTRRILLDKEREEPAEE